MNNGLDIVAQAFITSNLLLIQGLGLYALTRYTKDLQSATRAGLRTLVAMGLGGILLWLFGALIPNSLPLQIGSYLLVALVAAVLAPYVLGQKTQGTPNLLDSALVGLLLLMGQEGLAGVQNLWFALAAGVAYLTSLVIMATLRERLELAPIPKALRGTPILLITAGLLAIALLGFRF